MRIFNIEIGKRRVREQYTDKAGSFVSRWSRPPTLNTAEWLNMFSKSPRLAVVDRIASDTANIGGKLLRVEPDGTETEITSHPFLRFMDQPNPLYEMTGSAIWRLHEIYLLLVGESFLLIERDDDGRPVELWPVPPYWVKMTPYLGSPTYQILSPSGLTMDVPVDDMFVMKQLNPLDPFLRGLGVAESIADEVLAAGQRIVMLTGPSAAGKTTSAHKIADAIAARGHRSQVISLDDFYIGEGKYPKHPDGSDDYESLEALDLERLHACLKALYKTGVCDAPVFDFTIQRPSGTQRIDARDGVVIIEGLHALNPALTEELPEDAALCLYAGLREEYADSRDARCLATRDIRLARRLVRDCLFRGHGAAFTLGLWGHVCAGEDRYIKPYKPRANLLLDTTHTYEVCLWRTVLDAMPADPALTATQARQLAALREKFAAFPALGTELVPQNSMLREFIGK